MTTPLTADDLQAIRASARMDYSGMMTHVMLADIRALLATIDALQPNEHTKLVRVSTDLLPRLREWSEPVRFKITEDNGGVLTLLIHRGTETPKD